MIRFVDLRHVEEDTNVRFCYWDTVIDQFVLVDGEQAWNTFEEFEEAAKAVNRCTERYEGLTPAWALAKWYERKNDE